MGGFPGVSSALPDTHWRSPVKQTQGLRQRRVAHARVSRAEEENALEAGRLEAVALVLAQRGVFDRHRAGAVVADEEHRAAALVGVVVLDDRAGDLHGEQVAVAVDRAATAPARGAATLRVGAPPDRLVAAECAVE